MAFCWVYGRATDNYPKRVLNESVPPRQSHSFDVRMDRRHNLTIIRLNYRAPSVLFTNERRHSAFFHLCARNMFASRSLSSKRLAQRPWQANFRPSMSQD
jgi:hypothetical protein